MAASDGGQVTERLCPWPTLLIKGQFAQRIKSTDKKEQKNDENDDGK